MQNSVIGSESCKVPKVLIMKLMVLITWYLRYSKVVPKLVEKLNYNKKQKLFKITHHKFLVIIASINILSTIRSFMCVEQTDDNFEWTNSKQTTQLFFASSEVKMVTKSIQCVSIRTHL